jgi:heme/copper-type cytochrome/quinol oxidase subunit 3
MREGRRVDHGDQLGFTLTTNAFWSFYYTAAGLHALHVIGGVVIMGFVARDAAQGKELQRVELIGNYWHFVDVVWIFLFPLLYIAK